MCRSNTGPGEGSWTSRPGSTQTLPDLTPDCLCGLDHTVGPELAGPCLEPGDLREREAVAKPEQEIPPDTYSGTLSERRKERTYHRMYSIL